MEIRSQNQFQQNIQASGRKDVAGNAAYFNITDAFKPGTLEDKPIPDLKKAAETLFGKPVSQIQEVWENDENGLVFAANSSRVILGGYNVNVKAVDPIDGKLLWKSETKGFVKKGKDGTLFTAGEDRAITAVDPKTGKAVWQKEIGQNVRIIDVADDGTLYCRAGGKFLSLDPQTREIKAEFPIQGDPVVGKNGMVFGGGPDRNKVTAYDMNTGKKKWEADTEGMVRCAPAVGKDGTVYVGMVTSNSMIALDPETGKQKWSFKAGAGIVISPVVGEDGTVYVGDVGHIEIKPHLYAVDPDTGKEKWSFEGKDDFRSGISFLPDGSLTAPTGCTLNSLDPQTGKLRWSMEAKSYVFAPPVAGKEGKLFFGTNGRGMHCIRDSKLLEKELEEDIAKGEIDPEKDQQITRGDGFIDIGGVKLKVNK